MEEDKTAKPKNTRKRNKKNKKSATAVTAPTGEEDVPTENTYEFELEWCVNQVLIGLTTNEVDKHQFNESKKVLTTLLSKKAPLVSKRHLMRVCFGDYRQVMKTTTLESTRKKLGSINKPEIEEMLDLKIPYSYGETDLSAEVVPDLVAEDTPELGTVTEEAK
jgi:hypothetical protein